MRTAILWETVMSDDLMLYGLIGFAALAVGVVIYVLVFPYLSGEKAAGKRVKGVAQGRNNRIAAKAAADVANTRRQMVQDTLQDLEDRQKASKKVNLRTQLQRAGLDISPNVYWIASAITGVAFAVTTLVSMPDVPLFVSPLMGFVGGFGLPKWVVKFLTKRRQNKFLAEFANAIDVIVRGVKSGLPLNECLGIISRESADPIAGEFKELVEQQRVGVPLREAFERMMTRVPLPEVKFFAIVVGIQQQAGGNLSEALGNLAGVLRDRKTLAMKVSALSAEAKASAYVLGALPFIVMALVYMSTPDYIAILWRTQMGQFIMLCAGFWMMCGVLMMRKMINFKY